MKTCHNFAISLLLLSITLLVLSFLAMPATSLAGGLLPDASRILASDDGGISIEFVWSEDGITPTPEGLRLAISACGLEGETGAPMLPRYRGMIALPPGKRAQLDWRVLESRALRGRPSPFPTLSAPPAWRGDAQDAIPVELSIENAALFAVASPIGARLDEPSRLRDLSVVSLIVDPIAWSPESGLRLATRLRVDIRFVVDRSALDLRQPLRRPEKLWDAIYASSLLNPVQAPAWRERYPLQSVERAVRSQAALRVKMAENGIYGLSGAELTGDALSIEGIPLGTPLDDIAVFRRSFGWDAGGAPLFEEIPVPRFFVDRERPGLLDESDRMVFVGRRLADAEDSPDPIEWFSGEGVYWIAATPELVAEMNVEDGWEDDAGPYTVPGSFQRGQGEDGLEDFLVTPPQAFYIDASTNDNSETWIKNLYYFSAGHGPALPQRMNLRSPGYVDTSQPRLEINFQGSKPTDRRFFTMTLDNDNGPFDLPEMTLNSNADTTYVETLAPGLLQDGENELQITKRLMSPNDPQGWFAFTKYWRLDYESRYEALSDSLHFHADGLTGSGELRVSGLANDASNWLLLRSNGDPAHVLLDQPENQAGSSPDYEMRFRAQLTGDETWWLVDESSLRTPVLEEAADISCLDEAGPYDVLVISSDVFHEGMQRWEDYREDQGYRVKRLSASEVWDAFFHGSPGAIGLRNAARFAYQQWGTEALLLVGDCSEDARAINRFSNPNWMPAHQYHEHSGGSDELLTLEQWVVKFGWNEWPSMLMGRLPVGGDEDESGDQLTTILDKIECYESYDEGDCGGDWRKRFTIVADDSWQFDYESAPHDVPSETAFESGSRVIADSTASCLTGDIDVQPYYLADQTLDHYENWSGTWYPVNSEGYYNMISYFQSTLTPHFISSLTDGQTLVAIQSHGHSSLITHEHLIATNSSYANELDMVNHNRPFILQFFGCHGNAFAYHNEGSSSREDCVGEKLLFVDGTRGAVISYASEGYEYLGSNVTLGQHFTDLMFGLEESDGVGGLMPDWRFGSVQLAAEIRWNRYYYAYRYNLLGDPLLRMDAGKPRLRIWVNREPFEQGDFLPVLELGEPMIVDVLVFDEVYIDQASVTLRSADGDLPFTLIPAWVPIHAQGNTLDSLLAHSDTLFTDLLAPLDTLAAQSHGLSRAWYLHAELNYDPDRGLLVCEGLDQAGRLGMIDMPVAKSVTFMDESGDTLQNGQWIEPRGDLSLRILAPSMHIHSSEFSLHDDGELSENFNVINDPDFPGFPVFLMNLSYDWAPGVHSLEVYHTPAGGGTAESYGSIELTVDSSGNMLDALIFPNPFRDQVFLRYTLTREPHSGRLDIYTLTGRKIYSKDLHDLTVSQTHTASWDGSDHGGDRVANGVYIMRMVFEGGSGGDVLWEDKIVKMR